MAKLKQVSPIVPVSNLANSIEFFVDVLGFDIRVQQSGYACLGRDGVLLRLVNAGPDKDLTHPNSQMHCYVDVEGIDALYESMQPALSGLPEGRVRAPFDTDYGQREFHVIDPDALLLSFGEAIKGI